mmetsp:Transcript_11618/g.17706  ORF Transcript_11618/g.17706 Transcript_11618/m.17706 type:complete len:496 (+) Transcript_11618:145-1632(+)
MHRIGLKYKYKTSSSQDVKEADSKFRNGGRKMTSKISTRSNSAEEIDDNPNGLNPEKNRDHLQQRWGEKREELKNPSRLDAAKAMAYKIRTDLSKISFDSDGQIIRNFHKEREFRERPYDVQNQRDDSSGGSSKRYLQTNKESESCEKSNGLNQREQREPLKQCWTEKKEVKNPTRLNAATSMAYKIRSDLSKISFDSNGQILRNFHGKEREILENPQEVLNQKEPRRMHTIKKEDSPIYSTRDQIQKVKQEQGLLPTLSYHGGGSIRGNTLKKLTFGYGDESCIRDSPSTRSSNSPSKLEKLTYDIRDDNSIRSSTSSQRSDSLQELERSTLNCQNCAYDFDNENSERLGFEPRGIASMSSHESDNTTTIADNLSSNILPKKLNIPDHFQKTLTQSLLIKQSLNSTLSKKFSKESLQAIESSSKVFGARKIDITGPFHKKLERTLLIKKSLGKSDYMEILLLQPENWEGLETYYITYCTYFDEVYAEIEHIGKA